MREIVGLRTWRSHQREERNVLRRDLAENTLGVTNLFKAQTGKERAFRGLKRYENYERASSLQRTEDAGAFGEDVEDCISTAHRIFKGGDRLARAIRSIWLGDRARIGSPRQL